MESTQKKKIDISSFTEEELNARELNFNYWETINYIGGLMKSSELKAGLILSFFGIIFNFVYQNINIVKENLMGFNFVNIFLIFWLISTLLSMYYSVNTFIPRIEKKYTPNVFFFGDIISKFGSIENFSQTFLETNLNREEVYKHLGEQIYINSKITAAKFKNVNQSIKYLVASLFFLILTIISQVITTAI
jgi:hypothetical protein